MTEKLPSNRLKIEDAIEQIEKIGEDRYK